MDEIEAKAILRSELEKYRRRSYESLLKSAFAPLTDAFIISPGSEFIDEF